MKLKNHPNAQCCVIERESERLLISYTTLVIRMTFVDGKRYLECTGTYSATTRKHIGWFLKEYAQHLTYQDMKRIVGMGPVAM